MSDETLVYDTSRAVAMCLNDTAASVWRLSDGARTPSDIATCLRAGSGGDGIDEHFVWVALGQLSEHHLLDPPLDCTTALDTRQSRRDLLRTLGTAALAVPVVASILVPTPAQAASCLATGQVCSQSAQCCSGLCIAGLVCA